MVRKKKKNKKKKSKESSRSDTKKKKEKTEPQPAAGDARDSDDRGETPSVVTIRVVDKQTGRETKFRINRSAKLGNVFDAYYLRRLLLSSSPTSSSEQQHRLLQMVTKAQEEHINHKHKLRFVRNGVIVSPNATPRELALQDDDVVECVEIDAATLGAAAAVRRQQKHKQQVPSSLQRDLQHGRTKRALQRQDRRDDDHV